MKGPKTICFIIPDRLNHPVGGHKVVYQYANHLSSSGFSVIVANNMFRPSACGFWKETARKACSLIKYLIRFARHENTCRGWFHLDASIKEVTVWNFHKQFMPKADYYVATNALSAPFLSEYDVSKNNKIYFIQGFETWLVREDILYETYKLPVIKVAVAKSLAAEIAKHDADCQVISNGYDENEFHLDSPVGQRNKYSISMLFHKMAEKNCKMAFEALDMVKQSIPEIRVVLFGVYSRPDNLPQWYEYYQMPDIELHNHINNSCAIYVGPSSSEGFALTILEAMACGQAVACTDIPGYKEIALNDVNALISPINDAVSLSINIMRLINDDNLRIRLANAGYETSKQFTIRNSCKSFEKLFSKT